MKRCEIKLASLVLKIKQFSGLIRLLIVLYLSHHLIMIQSKCYSIILWIIHCLKKRCMLILVL